MSNLEAIKLLINSSGKADAENIFKYIAAKYPDMAAPNSLNILKNSKVIYGGVGNIKSFDPIGVSIEGWFLPRYNYDSIEVYCCGKMLGKAVLNVPRPDVYANMRIFNEKNAGFSLFVTNGLDKIREGHPIVVLVKKGGKIIRKQIVPVVSYTIEDSVKAANLYKQQKNILVPTLSNRLPMIYEFAKKMHDYNFITLIEGMEGSLDEVRKVCLSKYGILSNELNRMSMVMMPKIFARNYKPVYSHDNIVVTEEEKKLCEENEYFYIASRNFSKKYYVSLEYAIKYCCAAYHFAEELITTVKPECTMIWNKYSPLHIMIDYACKQRNIPVIYMESGLLPGTYIFESEGQMGESWPSTHSEEFLKLPVSEEECEKAEEIRQSLYESKLNRWTSTDASVYKKTGKDEVLGRIDPSKPLVFYAGQNDFESGFYPYTEHTRQFHSPVFESSDEAAVYLAKICDRNGWNFLYKRHPMMRGATDVIFPENVIMNDTIDIHDAIDISDVTVTILSQTSYVALIRNKPALMLGYHQLCNKGCVYEAWQKCDVEKQIKLALEKGFTQEQKDNFKKHIAQLCKYYLYTDFINHSVDFGKSLDDLVEYIIKKCEMSDEAVYDVAEGKNIESSSANEKQKDNQLLPDDTVFRLDLSFSERLERKKLANLMAGKNILGLMEKKYSAAEYLMSKEQHENFPVNLMYISQLDKEYLNNCQWQEVFFSMFYMAFEGGKDKFEHFVFRCLDINREVFKRLEILKNINKSFMRAFDDKRCCRALLEYSVDESDKRLKKICFGQLKTYLGSCDEEHKQSITECVEEIAADTDVKSIAKSYLFEILFQNDMICRRHIKMWNDILANSQNAGELMYFGGSEIVNIVWLKPELLYPEYYNDRKKVLKHLADVMEKHNTFHRVIKENREKKRIAIMVPGLHGRLFASTRLEMGVANEFAKRGYEVTIFVSDYNYIMSDDFFSVMPGAVRRNFSSMIYRNDHIYMAEPEVNIVYFNHETTPEERYGEYVNAILDYAPDVVIDITNENALYNNEIIKQLPVVTVPLNGYSSSSVYDAYIARNIEMAEQNNEIYSSVDLDKTYEANLYLPVSMDDTVYDRKRFGFSKDDFLIVTVGNRLDYEITPKIQADMRELLESNSNIKWILVGRMSNPLKEMSALIAAKRVRKWGYENNLSALYKMCDLYFDLPRSGGGGSTACAVQAGLPALIINMASDILPFLGVNTSVESWEDELKSLIKMSKNRSIGKKLALVQRKNLMSSEWSIEHYCDVIEEASWNIKKGNAENGR